MTTAVFLGDSFTAGTGATVPASTGYRNMAATRLGWTATAAGVGGSGYCNPTGGTYLTRLPDAIAGVPDVVVVQGSTNDVTSLYATQAEITAAAHTLYAAIRAALPSCLLYVLGLHIRQPGIYGAAIDAAIAAFSAAMPSVVAAYDGHWIDPMARVWITGTGKVDAPAGDGNADVYVGADNVHPTQAGHDYLGNRLAHVITYPFGAGFVGTIADASGTPIALGFQP